MKIGIDVDGVFTNIEQFQIDFGGAFFHKNYNLFLKNIAGYDTKDIFNVSIEMDSEFWGEVIEHYSKKEPARPFASEVTHKLKNKGHEIIIITARCANLSYTKITKDEMQEIVKKWLSEHNIHYDKIVFSGENKVSVVKDYNVDIMIEDSPKNIKELSEHIPVIAYNAKYNENINGQNILRAYSWYDVYNIIMGNNHLNKKPL